MIALLGALLLLSQLSPATAAGVDCEQRCQKYEAEKMKSKAQCSKAPDSASCFATFNAKWSSIGPFCDSRKLAKRTQPAQRATAIGYTVAGGVCAGMCALQFTGATAAADAACKISAGTAALGEITSAVLMVQMGKKTSEVMGALKSTASSAGMYTLTGKQITNMIRNKISQKVSNSCIATVFLGIVATSKWKNMKRSNEVVQDACQQVVGLDGQGATEAGSAFAPSTLARTQSSTPSSGRTQVSSASAPEEDWSVEESSPFPGGRLQAALAGPEGEFLGSIPNRENMLEEFKSATGMGLADVANQLDSGASPGSLIGSIEGLPPGMSEAMKDLESMVLNGELALASPGVEGTTAVASSGGATKETSEVKPSADFNFGFKGKDPHGDSKEIQFENKTQPKRILAGGDIWHSGFSGTIFEIVTERIDQSEQQVERLEWASPLNRALMGLPAREKPRK